MGMSHNKGDIFYANLNPVVGSEQGKTRPGLIVSNNRMNETAPIVIIAPLSGETHKAGLFNILLPVGVLAIDHANIEQLKKEGHSFTQKSQVLVDSIVLCNQTRAVDKRRLLGRVGHINDVSTIERIDTAIKETYAIDGCTVCRILLRANGLFCPKCNRVYRVKCLRCGTIVSCTNNFCGQCGRAVRDDHS